MASETKGIIVCLSVRGKAVADNIKGLLGNSWDSVLFDKTKDGSLADVFKKAWKYPAIVSVMANAITIRSISKLIESKKTDPAVVGVDEEGRFVVSLLGGHLAGANKLAGKIAHGIGATAVISTASDLKGVPAIDLLGSETGFVIEDEKQTANFMTKILDGEEVYLFTSLAEKEFKKAFEKSSVKILLLEESGSDPVQGQTLNKIIVSDNSNIEPNDRTLAFIPKRNFVGIGCKRGVSGQQIIEAINISLKKCDLSLSSVAGIATIDLKKNEQGLIEVARLLSLDVRFFSAEELSLVNAKSTSSFVKSKVGVGAVSEPAAMLVAGEDSKIIMSKNIVGGVTISIARANWPLSE